MNGSSQSRQRRRSSANFSESSWQRLFFIVRTGLQRVDRPQQGNREYSLVEPFPIRRTRLVLRLIRRLVAQQSHILKIWNSARPGISELKTALMGEFVDSFRILFRSCEFCAFPTLVWLTTQSFFTKSMGRVFSIQKTELSTRVLLSLLLNIIERRGDAQEVALYMVRFGFYGSKIEVKPPCF